MKTKGIFMQVNEEELSLLKEKIMESDDPHSKPFKQFLKDLPRMNKRVEGMKLKKQFLEKLPTTYEAVKKMNKDFQNVAYDASWALATVNAVLSQRVSRLKDKKILDAAERLYQMASAMLFEVELIGHAGCSYGKEPWALGWSFIRDRTIADAITENKPQLVYLELNEMRANCVPVRDMKDFTVIPYRIPVVVGVLKHDIDEKIKGWLEEQDKVNCESFFYDDQEFGERYAVEGRKVKHIVTEKVFSKVVADFISQLYDKDKPLRIVSLGVGDASEIRKIFSTLQKIVSKEKYEQVLNTIGIVGVDKYRAMGKHSLTTIQELGVEKYELTESDMVDFKPQKNATTIYLLSNNTRNNLDEDKRSELDKNITKNMKIGDLYIREEYCPPIGKELETALGYANYPPIHACIKRALYNGAVALVVQYDPNHPEGGNVEFFSVYRDKPVYRIHFRSVRRNIDTIKKDGPLLGCNINIHVDPEEHIVTSVLSK